MTTLRPADPVAVNVTRGPTLESRHRAHVAVVDASGTLVASFGEPTFPTYLRSIAKPFQALPLLSTGAADRFGFTDAELAICCGSHNGEAGHAKLVEGMLAKIGLPAEALRCGAHAPYHEATAAGLQGKYTPLHNNCSGKHAGMLALALHLGQDPATYLDPKGAVQRAILDALVQITGVPADRIPVGVDGCTAPTFNLRLHHAARAFALLARPWRGDKALAPHLERLQKAMWQNAWYVAGSGRFDTQVMEAAEGRLLCKVGGEAVQAVADFETGHAMVIKIEDGNGRAVSPVAIEAARQLGWLEPRALEVLGDLWRPALRNHNSIVVGTIEPVLELTRHDPPKP
ncbi:MAG TPA: asparaginase [Candidatus Thermoplasmatota archaeon]|nr:asparaginase [Candidatus Thermoplasmatota archaeon]